MRTLFLSSGHSNKAGRDMGAQWPAHPAKPVYIEGVEAAILRSMIRVHIEALGGKVVTDDSALVTAETVKAWRKLISWNSISVDIHFNAAGNQSVSGTESLVPVKPSNFEIGLAGAISLDTANILGTPRRGIVNGVAGVKTEDQAKRGKLAWMTLPGETVLWEVEFLTNPTAMTRYRQRRDQLAQKIAATLFQFMNS